MAARLLLPDVTLCCVDTRSPELAWHAIELCLAQAQFGETLFIGPNGWSPPENCPAPVRYISIEPLKGINAYSDFLLKRLAPHIQTSHVLIIQWDGFVLRPDLWMPEFLAYDYIGPPWYHGGHPGMVGNGGFSLRSNRLLNALTHFDAPPNEPEDVVICRDLRPELERLHNIQFAPLNVAQLFGCEYGPWRDAFGFHGMHNFAHFMPDQQLSAWLEQAPADILSNKHTRKLIKELMRNKRARLAIALIKRRSKVLGWTVDQCLLVARALCHQATGLGR